MSQRLVFPGKWLWQLPGTFLAPNETIENCAFRGLKEKTNVQIPEDILRANIKVQSGYHHPHRSMRGRILTEAFLVHLPNRHRGEARFPKVKAPAHARSRPWWVSLADLKPEDCYEDHHLIIQDLLRRSRRD
jgi:bifunctional NMN adenylyltransferase/nudix hydrolase